MAVPGSQQPVGQETESQTQLPLTQCWLTAHSLPTPQAQAPAFEQPSLLTGSHDMHAEPFRPHALTDRPLHVDPEQQPLGQLAAQPAQIPPAQEGTAPAVQAWQFDPPLPHICAFWAENAWHAPVPSQHPSGHDLPSHTQVPLRQRCPV
jgi:hypothetical protein